MQVCNFNKVLCNFTSKYDKKLLQNQTILFKNATAVRKFDNLIIKHGNYYKIQCLLQNDTIYLPVF